MDSFEAEQERLHARQMAFLQSCSPDDWHRYAFFHNWNERLDGLFWIVSQPQCDKATALLIFWKGEPTGYDYEGDDEAMGDDVYAVAPMLRYISERFNTGGYARSEIAYDFLEATGHDADSEYAPMIEAGRLRDFEALVERQQDLPDARVKLHPDMMVLRLPGRKVGGYNDDSDFYDRFPEDVDDGGSEPPPVVAMPSTSLGDLTNTHPPRNMTTDSTADASARVRAMRHQRHIDNEDASPDEDASGLSTWIKRLLGR